jgi:hypothetical protein
MRTIFGLVLVLAGGCVSAPAERLVNLWINRSTATMMTTHYEAEVTELTPTECAALISKRVAEQDARNATMKGRDGFEETRYQYVCSGTNPSAPRRP